MIVLAELAPEQRHLDVKRVLVAVADEDALRVAMNRQRGEKLGLAPDLQPEFVRRAGIHDFFHHFAQLIHLDREDAAVLALVSGLGDGGAEFLVQDLHAVAQQILETEQQRQGQPAIASLLRHRHEIKRRALVLNRAHGHVAGIVDPEVGAAPPGDVVSMERAGDIPRF